jgi:hypothetical protein
MLLNKHLLPVAIVFLVPDSVFADVRWLRQDTARVTLFFEEGQLSDAQRQEFARLVDQGVRDVGVLLYPGGVPGRLSRVPITFYVGTPFEISSTRGRTVFLPVERVRNRSAPYLHETVHVLLPVSEPLWLIEGFASYVQSRISETMGGYDGQIFGRGGNRRIDEAARRHLRSEGGVAVLPWVGTGGAPPGLFRDRWRVAAPFYVLSHSFSKFLVERMGLPAVMSLFDARDDTASWGAVTGRGAHRWKQEWLESLGAAGVRPAAP